MVLGEENLWDHAFLLEALKFITYDAPRKKLFAYPLAHRGGKVVGAIRSVGKVCGDEATDFFARLIVEHNGIKIGNREIAFRKTIDNGVAREILIVFLARKPLFARRSDDIAIYNKRGSAVVIKRRNPQYT